MGMSNETWNWLKSSDCSFVCKKCSQDQHSASNEAPSQNPGCSKVDIDSQNRRKEASKPAQTSFLVDESNANTSAWQQVVRQEFARERRKKQIVMTGLIIDHKSTHDDTYENIDDVIKELYFKFGNRKNRDDFSTDRFEFKLIGKPNDEKPCPILIEFQSEITRDRILKMAFTLKDSAYSAVYLQNCLSKEEQREQYLLREKRRQNSNKSH